jgi:pilus assembly protein FimV
MKNPLRICIGLLLSLVLMTFTHEAVALGLGNASVDSYLNQPLRARIALTTRTDEDLSTVTAGLASADDFALIGASLEAIPVPLSFSVKQEDEGSFILVSSNLPVRDPVIRLIVEVTWAKGRMLREYTLFLDPPVFVAPAPSPVLSEQPSTGARPVVEPETRDEAKQEGNSAAETETPMPSSAENAGGEGEYGPVKSGETLWRIASNWSQGTGLSMSAAMLAIQRNNPQAFIRGNVNLLKQGAILRLPEYSEAAQISAEVARNEIAQQSQGVSQAESQLATQMASPQAVETPLVDEMSAENVAATDSQADGQQDQLELVPPAKTADEDSTFGAEESVTKAGASTAVEALRQELARKEEELIAQQQENQDLQERLKEMEATLATGQQGTVANQDLAQMEEKMREDRLSKAGFESQEAQKLATEKPEAAPAAQAQAAKTEESRKQKSWFSGVTAWLIGLLVVGAAAAGWMLSRRGKETAVVTGLEPRKERTVKGIKEEAEKILKVLDPDSRPEAAQAEQASNAAQHADVPRRVPTARKQDEAEFLDEDSADPEVRLDLARAYIAMGDREAARVILAEVIEHGSDQQKAESQALLAAL